MIREVVWWIFWQVGSQTQLGRYGTEDLSPRLGAPPRGASGISGHVVH